MTRAKGLRSRLTAYGDDGFSLFLRKSFIAAAGFTDDALDRPIVGIAATGSDFNPCHTTVPDLIEAVKRGVAQAGGLPLAFPTISLHESFAHPTSMLLRNLMAMDTEEMLNALPVDAAVLIGGCDKTVPAQLMAAISADVPALQLVVGPMLAGHHDGRRLGACTDCRRLWAAHRAGDIDAQELSAAAGQLMPTHGTCMVMGTASTMAAIAEVLGFMLPGGATIPAVLSERLRFAETTGAHAVAVARKGAPKPNQLVTPAAITNAMTMIQALGGSTNAVVHLAAIAGRAGLTFDLDAFDAIGRAIPVIPDLKPAGQGFMEDLHKAGGIPAVLHRLTDRFDLSAPTVAGTLGDALAPANDDAVVRPLDNPVAPAGAIAVLRGNLAPDGAVIKHAAASAHLLDHTGPALVFESLADLAARLDDPDLDVTADHVLVLRNAGPRGAPGMPEAGSFPIPRKLAAAGVTDMVRISDARMSGTSYGTVILHAAPEAAVGGPLALVQTGDPIHFDLANRRLELGVEPAELARRRAAWTPPAPPPRGYRRLYHDHVMQADAGCDFDFLVDTPISATPD